MLNYTATWSRSAATSGIGPDNWMPCCSNFGDFVCNPIIETAQEWRAGEVRAGHWQQSKNGHFGVNLLLGEESAWVFVAFVPLSVCSV